MTAYVVGRKGANHYGRKPSSTTKHGFQATHDMGVSAIFLHFRRTDHASAEQWMGEDIIKPFRRRQKLPDAILAIGPERSIRLVVEFGGAYPPERVRDFHDDCAARGLPYELW